ncbi:Spy0128 family protein [Ruminococcus sp. 1001136sp1]|uniref:Spy0128 family protein n=1 Tax=Ruminococcus sp. 1001136sp1 TaxID=2986996 RepID=UPI0023301BD9|nr:FctA domain-containing protein [Ruminococcus sp. 1001136sp1]MDB8770607.1 FctA domain-containing protein [Ruminococcus sp. 1001136sp1]
MKKNSRLKSFFAILLAVSMIFQQSSLTVLATDDIYVEDATATPTPSESEAEAYATEEGAEPVAEKQEEPQQVQETPAAEQAQEPTEVPAEQPTEAPAEQPTEAPVEQPTEAPAAAPTEAPATEPTAAPAAEVTEAPAAPEATATPAAEATATPTPEVSASPSETPTPAPTETPKTSFRYEDSRVVITATAPEDANLPQDAEIKADYIAPGTDRYNAAVAAFNSQLSSQLGLDAENTEAEYVLYDVYFLTADGSRIEPESGNVKVDMSFKEIQKSTVDGDVVNKDVVHLDNEGQAEVVTEYVNTNADGEITSMGFTQDSFSIVGGVTTVQNVAVQTGSSKLSDFITGMTIKVDGKEISSNDKISPSARYDFTISFAETSELVNQGKHIQKNMTFSMPNNLTNWPESGKLYADDNKTVVGDYTINDAGDVSVVFTDEFMQQADKGLVKGNFTFSAEIKNTVTDEVVKITVPGTTIEKEIHVNRDVNLYTEKSASYDEKTGEITYTIITKAENGNATDVKIIDKLGSDLELVKDSQGNEYTLTVDGGTPTPGKFAVTGNGYEVTVGELLKDKTATLVYKARFKDGVLEKIRNGESYSTNNGVVVKGKNGSKDIISNEPSVDIGNNFKNNQWFKKDNAKLVTEGGKTYLEWSFVYNVDGKQPVKGNTVTDTLQDNEYTKFKKGDVIHVKRSDGVEFDITVPADGNTWSYTIGKNSGDNYTDDSLIYKYTFSYKTLVDEAKLDSLIGSVSVKNDVDDGNRNHPGASGSGPLTGKVPNPEKTFLSGTQDKMKWRVTIHVPAGGMKFFIKDTVRQGSDNEDADGWNKWGWIDTSSITVTDPGKKISKDNVKYGQNVEGGKLCNYLFFLSKDSSGSDVETNKTYSEIEGIGEARDIILEYETFNKYQNATGDVAYKPGVLVRNTASGNGWEVFADGYVPGKLQVAKENVSSYFTGYGADDKKWSTEGNKICYCITIDKKRIGLGTEDVIITDTHSSSLSYVLGSAKLMWAQNEYKGDSNASGSDEAAGWMADPTIEENGKTVLKLNLGKLTRTYEGKNCVYKLYYQMAVDESLVTSSDGQVLSNSVSVKANGEDAAGEASCDYTYKKPLFTKEENSNPSVSNGYQAGFKITVKYTDNYKNSDGHLEIDDNCTNLKIDYSTFSVKQGERLLTANADYIVAPTSIGMKILILNPVEDATYVIEYKATVTGSIGSKIDYGNTAYINGRDEYYSKVSNNVEKKQNSSGNVEVSSLKLLLYKYDEENASKGLPNAIFELQDSNGKVLKSGIKTKANGETDEIQLSKQLDKTVFDLYVKYKLVETTAPSGYKTGNPIEFYFTDYSKSADELVKMGLQDAIAVFSNSTVVGTIEINNKKAEDVEGSAELEIQKAATGNWSGEIPNYFKFKLEALTPGAPELSNKEAANTGSKVTFEKITGYKEAKDYIYKISETGIIGEHPEWTVSGDVLYAKVSVRKEGNEYKTAVSYYSDENCTTAVETPVITNTYTAPTEGSAELEIQKAATENWTGKIPNYFQFKLEALTEGAPMPGTTAVTNNGSDVSFGKITGYKEVKDYIYKISEKGIIGEHPEWTVSGDVLYAKVSVRKEGNEYKTKVSYYSDENCTTAVETPVIINNYTTSGQIVLSANKTLEGQPLEAEQFSFQVTEIGEDGNAVENGYKKIAKNAEDGSIVFPTIKYEKTGIYYYQITEINGKKPAYKYDGSKYVVAVNVTDNMAGKLTAAIISVTKDGKLVENKTVTFNNTYSASADLELKAQKSMKVESEQLGTFEFELSGDNIETQTVTNNEAGAITFAPIHYNLSDVGNTYTYTVREKAPSTEAQYETDGIKYVYDTTVYTVKVKVEDNGDGTLKLTKTVKIGEKDYTDPEMKFVNDTTKATITKVDALGNQLSGVELEVRDKNNEVVDSWTTDGTPHVITGALILGETYKLVEKSAPAGYTLADPVEFTVSENDTDNKVEMKNTYSASGSLNLTAKKTLTTTETPLAKDQFTFELRDKEGKVLQTKTNDADGNVIFDEIKYSLVKDAAYKDNTDKKVDDIGEYQYTVNEVKGDAAGYTYDDTIYIINVTVTDAGNGTLTVTPVIHSSKATSEDATVTGMEFTNTYTTSGQIALGATKTLEGQTLEAEQFSFQATEMDADGKAVENGYSETVKNADGGAITFPIITYKESGTHYYQITEVKDEKPAYQYDESKYVVKVDVTDDNAGKLTAKVTSVTKNGEPVKSEDLTGAVTFTNTYSASADLELKAQKSMKVEAEQLGTFEFELKDADGKVIETVKNDEKGAISFSKLSYTEKDAGKTFTYTVNEKLPSEADTYVYDKTVYTVTVNVEDNRDGTLKLTTKVNGEDYTETAMKFVNDTTKVTISKVDDTTLKALAGAKLQVVDDQDKVVEEWTSDGTPHVITAKLVLGKTYKLVEAEAPSGYEIAEPITFTVDADDTKNAVEMKDAMTKSKTAAIEITKELKLNDALAGAKDMTFYAVLFADAECTIPASDVKALEFKNASSSTVTFTNLDLGRTYYVSETDVTGKAIDSGMTPDEKVYVPVYPQGQAITVTEDGAKSSITFENQFSEWPDGFYKIATLNVTKKLLGADGNALESDEIFYAGIFDDKECTTLSTRTEKNILTLDLAGGSTVSESTQAVVIPDESFTLYVAETDAEGNLVGGTDGFRYAVTVENGNVLFNENNLNAEVTIINQEQPEATPTVTPEETITPTPTPGTSTGVKTGDDTPIGFYMALLFVAALAIEETTRRRRKKEQD